MVKKVIQLPIDDNLLADINYLSRKKRKARAEVIREACVSYLAKTEQEELERLYQQGYENLPETSDTGEIQLTILKDVAPGEKW
jgi:metal-responsive CopG/Arc/MetJ family transcriptional regulator